jgi:hypothetical protein
MKEYLGTESARKSAMSRRKAKLKDTSAFTDGRKVKAKSKGIATKKSEIKGTLASPATAKKTYTKKTVAKVDKLTDKRNKLAKKAGKAAASGKVGSTAKTNRLTNRAVRKNKRMARVIKRNK